MQAVDVTPNRLELARREIVRTLLDSPDRQLGMVVFSADAFIVAPLTHDAGTLIHLLRSLDHAVLPRQGSRPDLAIDESRALLRSNGLSQGDSKGEVIFVGDSPGDMRAVHAASRLAAMGVELSVVAIGTEAGGPIRLAQGDFAMDGGEPVVSRLDVSALRALAEHGGGSFRHVSSHQGSVNPTVRQRHGQSHSEADGGVAQQGARNVPLDDGIWIVLALLPISALAFRRGWLVCVVCVLALPPPSVEALEWQDLWFRADQQAQKAFLAPYSQSVPQKLIAKLAHAPSWQAALAYREGDADTAARIYGKDDSASGHYNRGNALAKLGQLHKALAAYARALEVEPAMTDALFNQALVRAALNENEARAQSQRGAERQSNLTGGSQSPKHSPQSGKTGNPPPVVAQTQPERGDVAKASSGGAARADSKPDLRDINTLESQAERSGQSGLGPGELRRLEGLLSRLPEDPGSLLKRRFAVDFRTRTHKPIDTGPKW